MSYAVPPEIMEPLSYEIGEKLTFTDLGDILYKCEGRKVINDFANETWPKTKIARACLEAAENTGTIRVFLGLVRRARPENPALRDLIEKAFPGLEALMLDLATAAGSVGSAALKTSFSNKGAVDGALIADTIQAVEKIVDEITILETYKQLHDSLHQMQTRQFSYLRELAKSVATNPDALHALQLYQDQVVTSHISARAVFTKLPNIANIRAIEQKWIDKMEVTIDRFQNALSGCDVAGIRACIEQFSNALEREQPRLNGEIFLTANQLPLLALTETLERVKAAAGPADPGLAETCVSLRELRATLLARVVEHNMWQDADDRIWGIDNMFDRLAHIEIGDFMIDWPLTRAAIRALSESEPDAKWSKSITRYCGQVDNELIEFEKSQALAGTADQIKNRLKQAYLNFRQEARMRFFMVDQLLKTDCAALAGIGPPLQELLRRLGDG